jgi:DNA-directed RNA polymerase subunit RPC12/RpoP
MPNQYLGTVCELEPGAYGLPAMRDPQGGGALSYAARSAFGRFQAGDVGKEVCRVAGNAPGGVLQMENDSQLAERLAREAALSPVYGLRVAYRPYRCRNCGHRHPVQTNHTGPLLIRCPSCSWRPSWGPHVQRSAPGAHPLADRPHLYAGAPVTAAERNPHAVPVRVESGS